MASWAAKLRAHLFPYSYARKELPGPGSANLAYLDLALNYQTPIGAGIANHYQYTAYGAGMAGKQIGLSGIGGIIHGQIYNGPLTVVQSNGVQ